MKSSKSQILINALPELVWSAITEAKYVKKWQYGSNIFTNWEIGSTIKFQTEWEGKLYEQWGKILEYDPYKTLSYSLFAPRPGLEDIPENYFIMVYELKKEGMKTLLSIIQNDNRNIETNEAEESNKNDNPILIALKNIVEKGLD